MKVWVIGHPEAVQGFALVGVHGVVAESTDGMHKALDEALSNKDLGIVLVTDISANWVRERFEQLCLRVETPIFIEIPGPNGPRSGFLSLAEIADQAIGVRR